MVEKAENPTKRASQEPDDQNKTTTERVDKQSIEEETVEETVGDGNTDFVKGSASPDKTS